MLDNLLLLIEWILTYLLYGFFILMPVMWMMALCNISISNIKIRKWRSPFYHMGGLS